MRADLLTDDKRKKEERKERRGGKKRTSRMFYFHLHDNESFREREREGERTYSSGKSKVSDSKASQRVGIIKTTEGKCFRVGG